MKQGKKGNCIAAGVCFLLGALLLAVPGIRFSSYLCFGLGSLLLVWLGLRIWSEKSRAGKWCKSIFLAGCAAVCLVLCCFEAVILCHGEEDNMDCRMDAIIVLGAGVNGETPSLTLQTRIDTALECMLQHPGVPVVLSGGQGPGEDITEAECMWREIISHPDRPTDTPLILLQEDRSTSTAENFAFSKEVLTEYGIDTETAVIGVVTNDFHMYRAKLIARREGLQTVGVPAELPWWWLTANYYARESFALVKTLIFD